jgi:Flp pilus assembly protein TadD
MAAPAATGRKRPAAKRPNRDQQIDRALSRAVSKARRRAFAEGLAVPEQVWGEAKVRWVKA